MSLSDKEVNTMIKTMPMEDVVGIAFYKPQDVKEAVKEWILSLIPDDKPIDCINKLKKIFGDKLI